MSERKEVKKITVEYADGSVKDIDRGLCFSVVDKGEEVQIKYEGETCSEKDEITFIAIMAGIAKAMGISNDLCERVE